MSGDFHVLVPLFNGDVTIFFFFMMLEYYGRYFARRRFRDWTGVT